MIRREYVGYMMVGALVAAIIASFMGNTFATFVCGFAFILLLMLGPLISE